ncbi:hypothetical protein QYE76_019892 [Lolium multiflorum]|uniref:CCHC-type domain-containing protein n=1 Tax=Lolium multiflorum TaxID=4521 RepID=A0AAD8VRE3_LOLMU|nr:hypothetical protein QYE76_019892 [Lolium multiflorum]
MSSSPSRPPGFQNRWQRATSAESVSSVRPRGQDHVSGMGVSSASGESEEVAQQVQATAVHGAVQGPARGRVQDRLVWQQPKRSSGTMWRLRQERQRAEGERKRKALSPEMDGICFNCYREGHRKTECTFETVCLRCGEEGHEAKACERPRSPSSEEDLCHAVIAKRARRASPEFVRASTRPGARDALESDLPPPPPPPPQTAKAPCLAWPPLRAAPELALRGDPLLLPLGRRPVRPCASQAQATQVSMRSKVHLVIEGIPPHPWENEVVEDLLGKACAIETVAPESRTRSDMSCFRLSAWTSDLESIPVTRMLVVPEPVEPRAPELGVKTLQYKILIHVKALEEDEGAETELHDMESEVDIWPTISLCPSYDGPNSDMQLVLCVGRLQQPENMHAAQMEEVQCHAQEEETQSEPRAMGDESITLNKIKMFCTRILKTLAPPLLREVETSSRLRAEAEPFTPRRVTRKSALAALAVGETRVKKATAAETVLLKALGITPADLSVNEADLQTFRDMFDSPIREQHLRVVASIFGKIMLSSSQLREEAPVLVAAH